MMKADVFTFNGLSRNGSLQMIRAKVLHGVNFKYYEKDVYCGLAIICVDSCLFAICTLFICFS